MDWNNVRGTPPPKPEPPAAHVVEACWRFTSPTGRTITCLVVSDDAPGLEVRCGYGDEDLLRSQRSTEIGSARELAEEWRQAVLAKGSFRESD